MHNLNEQFNLVVTNIFKEDYNVEEIYKLIEKINKHLLKVNLTVNNELTETYNYILKEIVKSLENMDYVYLLDLVQYTLYDFVNNVA